MLYSTNLRTSINYLGTNPPSENIIFKGNPGPTLT